VGGWVSKHGGVKAPPGHVHSHIDPVCISVWIAGPQHMWILTVSLRHLSTRTSPSPNYTSSPVWPHQQHWLQVVV
jgi:hypothetical protein